MNFLKFKRAKKDHCNICTLKRKLTWDHVPPKGSVRPQAIEIKNIFDKLFQKNSCKRNFEISQNGLKYRTICSDCNNRILGKNYDPELNKFSIDLKIFIQTELSLPSIIHIEVKPIPIIKAVLGHLLAANIDFSDTPFENKLRPIILNVDAPIPDDIHVFYWIYPYSVTTVMRDIVMPTKRGSFSSFSQFHILKYFPVAYLITEDTSHYHALSSLSQYNRLRLDETANISINLQENRSSDWPEKVEPGNVVAFGKLGASGIRATERKN